MKRILAVVLGICVLASIVAFAEGIDFSSMSDGELFELRQAVEDELGNRGLWEGDPIASGRYVVGKDIKAGRFIIRCASISSAEFLEVVVYTEDDELITYDFLEVGESVSVRLEEGDYLTIDCGDALISMDDAEYSWRP